MVGGIHIKNKENIGYVLWKLETLHDFFPCYEHLIQDTKQKNISHHQDSKKIINSDK